jgi:hypothetical protein
MKVPQICDPQVHELLEVEPDSLSTCIADAPFWAREALASCAWVVVRRAHATEGQIPVGVRGAVRHERWSSSAREMVCEGSLDLKSRSICSVHHLSGVHSIPVEATVLPRNMRAERNEGVD